MRKTITVTASFFFLIAFHLGCSQHDIAPSHVKCREGHLADFPNNFKSGRLDWGTDCEYFLFRADRTFSYKFYGGCHGGARFLKGTWAKSGNSLILDAELYEGPRVAGTHCRAEQGSERIIADMRKCKREYRKDIRADFGKYPAVFKVAGSVSLNKKREAVVVLESVIKGKVKGFRNVGLLRIEGDSFGCMKETKQDETR